MLNLIDIVQLTIFGFTVVCALTP